MLGDRRIAENLEILVGCRIIVCPCSLLLRGEGGGLRSKLKFLIILNFLKIWNTGVQELFTEFKKLLVQKNADVANSACIATCREMYRISHIVENGQIFAKSFNDLSIG